MSFGYLFSILTLTQREVILAEIAVNTAAETALDNQQSIMRVLGIHSLPGNYSGYFSITVIDYYYFRYINTQPHLHPPKFLNMYI